MKIHLMIDPNDQKYLPLSQTRKILDLIENSKDFDKSISKLRSNYKIPSEGFLYDYRNKKFDPYAFIDSIVKDLAISFESDCQHVAMDHNLPHFWDDTIAFLAFFNVLIPPKKEAISVWYNPSDDKDGDRYEVWFDLVFRENLSKAQFLNEIEKWWPDIEDSIKLLSKPAVNKMIRTWWAKFVYDQRESSNPKKHFFDIANNLQDEIRRRDQQDIIISEEYARTLYKRWKDKIVDKSNNKKK